MLVPVYVGFEKGKILERSINTSNKKELRRDNYFSPRVFVPAPPNTNTGFTDIHGSSIKEVRFDSYYDILTEKKRGIRLFGIKNPTAAYITEKFKDIEIPTTDNFKIKIIDIETTAEHGQIDVKAAKESILLITTQDYVTKKLVTYSVKAIDKTTKLPKDVTFKLFDDEKSLLAEFVNDWLEDFPHVVSGWNSLGFDIPYIINRIKINHGAEFAERLSPFHKIKTRTITTQFKTKEDVYDIVGIHHLDLRDVYIKHANSKQRNYRLDTVAEAEVGEKKLKSKYRKFREFYQKEWDTFVKYNIKDVQLVTKIAEKKNLFDLCITLAYMTSSQLGDILLPIRLWTNFICNFISKRNQYIEFDDNELDSEDFEGAFVKEPIPGFYKWIMSVDATSLYPSIMRALNSSPETFAGFLTNPDLSKYTIGANGACFRKDKLGIIPELVGGVFDKRVVEKDQMKDIDRKIQSIKQKIKDANNSEECKQLYVEIDTLQKQHSQKNTLQNALKILANSVYGAMGCKFFAFYLLPIAEAITKTGQALIRTVEKSVNSGLNKYNKNKTIKDYIVAMDTDSLYIVLEEFLTNPNKQSPKDYCDVVEKFYQDNITPHINSGIEYCRNKFGLVGDYISFKREAIASCGFWTAKKRYALLVYDNEYVRYNDGKIKITGLETVKSTIPQIVSDKIMNVIEYILHSKPNREIIKLCEDFEKEYKQIKDIEIIAPSTSVNDIIPYTNKDQESHTLHMKGAPSQVKGAIVHNHYIKKLGIDYIEPIHDGDKVSVCALRLPNPLRSDIVAFSGELPVEFEVNDYVDYKFMFKKTFTEPVDRMLSVCGLTREEEIDLFD